MPNNWLGAHEALDDTAEWLGFESVTLYIEAMSRHGRKLLDRGA